MKLHPTFPLISPWYYLVFTRWVLWSGMLWRHCYLIPWAPCWDTEGLKTSHQSAERQEAQCSELGHAVRPLVVVTRKWVRHNGWRKDSSNQGWGILGFGYLAVGPSSLSRVNSTLCLWSMGTWCEGWVGKNFPPVSNLIFTVLPQVHQKSSSWKFLGSDVHQGCLVNISSTVVDMLQLSLHFLSSFFTHQSWEKNGRSASSQPSSFPGVSMFGILSTLSYTFEKNTELFCFLLFLVNFNGLKSVIKAYF